MCEKCNGTGLVPRNLNAPVLELDFCTCEAGKKALEELGEALERRGLTSHLSMGCPNCTGLGSYPQAFRDDEGREGVTLRPCQCQTGESPVVIEGRVPVDPRLHIDVHPFVHVQNIRWYLPSEDPWPKEGEK